MNFLIKEKNAVQLANILELICTIVIIISTLACLLTLLGRVEINLTIGSQHYDNTLLLTKNHGATSRFLFTNISDQTVYIRTQEGVDFITWLGVSLIGLLRIIPTGFCFYQLKRFFQNMARQKVFVPENANRLFYTGIALLLSHSAGPLCNSIFIPLLVNALSPNSLSLSTLFNSSGIFFGIICMLASYVMHYGIYLQEEVDHTV